MCGCFCSSWSTEQGDSEWSSRYVGPWSSGFCYVSIPIFFFVWFTLGFFPCRLSGVSPFFGDNPQITRFHIKEGRYDFNATAFEQVSQDAKDFIRSLLQLHPQWVMHLYHMYLMPLPWQYNAETVYQPKHVRNTPGSRLSHTFHFFHSSCQHVFLLLTDIESQGHWGPLVANGKTGPV